MYLELDHKKIVLTIERLGARIGERFPSSGLRQVCNEFLNLASRSRNEILWIARPNIPIRGGVISIISLVLLFIFYSVRGLEMPFDKPGLSEALQLSEVIINELILMFAALFFLLTWEKRIKRARVLNALHKLRSIAHVVDMHQLTKDPSMVDQSLALPNSPKRELTQFQLKRYLDYCSELLSLIGKLAALYSERLPEPEIVTAANEIEELCANLSQKVWQKITTIG